MTHSVDATSAEHMYRHSFCICRVLESYSISLLGEGCVIKNCVLHFRDTKVQALNALLSQAKQFAYGLLQTWNMGRCQEDIVILYSRDNNIVILLCFSFFV